MIITCPESSCRAENDARRERCIRCETPLRSYVKLLNQHHHLFNQGLKFARSGDYTSARDAFAAVVAWCPRDIDARNALAMTCFALRDWQMARVQWEKTLEQAPGDTLACQGLERIPQVEERPARFAAKKILRIPQQLNHAHDHGRDKRKKR